jgi:CTP synthase
VISSPNAASIYEVPLQYEGEKFAERILEKFQLKARQNNLGEWKKFIKNLSNAKDLVKIGIVGKYFETGKFTLADSYISVIEAVKHAAWFFGKKPEIFWLAAEVYEKNPSAVKELGKYDGIIIPGGFGTRGVEGKIKAVGFCRAQKIPFLGLCLGMQLATIEFARNICGIKDATSTEFDSQTKNPVIDVMPDQKQVLKKKNFGATMRLGAYDCQLKKGTRAYAAYGNEKISERHRHRYELNNAYRKALEEKGLVIAGVNPQKDLVEIVELKDHPFFAAVQFHPEFKSRPLRPHPLFREFMRTAITARNR